MKLKALLILLLALLTTAASTAGSGVHLNREFLLPFNAVDGSHFTSFNSAPSAPQWFYVDLGRDLTVDKVRFHWWGDRQPRDFEIQVSTDATTDLHFESELPARHIRFFGVERDNPEHGYGIVELAVFRDVLAASKN